MSNEPKLVTVYRSADTSARDDAEEVRALLEDDGILPVVLGDDQPGVPSGAVEVRVPAADASRADRLILAASEDETPPEAGDPSSELDLETVFSAIGVSAELESLGVRGVLDSNGIPNVFVSPPQYPNLRFVLKVPRRYVEQARQALAEAEAAGPAAAEAAEKAGEE